jgi:acyl-CoA synthetase (AMP-forming)/AMP-acid ligase II
MFCYFQAAGTRADPSFRKFREQAGAYAALYRASGLKKGDVVLIMLRHSPEMCTLLAKVR